MTLLQATAIATSDLTIERVAIGIAGMTLMGFWREMRSFREESRNWQTRIETALFGANGDNGINGTVKALAEDVKQLQRHAD